MSIQVMFYPKRFRGNVGGKPLEDIWKLTWPPLKKCLSNLRLSKDVYPFGRVWCVAQMCHV